MFLEVLFLFFCFCFYFCLVLFCLSCFLSKSEYVSLSELLNCEQVFRRLEKPMVSGGVKFGGKICLNIETKGE